MRSGVYYTYTTYLPRLNLISNFLSLGNIYKKKKKKCFMIIIKQKEKK